ncbi:MAG TPA: glycine zipper 2TM domain-containing protein [Gemmatimonadaceae bacterium]|nr:glycine zipper 2TM domain-containing protein [Gemmatimonadaceae bacterium]
MHVSRSLVLVPALFLAAACSSKKNDSADDALKNDLALAASQQPYQPQQFVSPMEQGYYGQNPAAMQYAPNGYAAGPYYQPAPQQVVYRTAPTARRSTSSGGGYGSGTVYRAPAPRVVKHTKRDAAIGAAAGAIIGSQVHKKDRMMGGIVGAAAGAILGGALGNNVDIDKH